MAAFIGVGPIKSYSENVALSRPAEAGGLYRALRLPEGYRDNVIMVRNGKVVAENDFVYDDDEILIFPALMGG